MLAEQITAPVIRSDGAAGPLRGTRTGALVVAAGHGALVEPAARGNIMIVCTAAAGVAPGTALSTSPPLVIWNPPASGKNLAILKASIGYVSGTLGAGSIVYASGAQATPPTTGTEITPASALLGATRGVGRAFSGSTLTVAPTLLRPVCSIGAITAATAFTPALALDLVDGGIIIPPGGLLAVQGIAAAGTSPLVLLSLIWEELPV